MHVLRSDAPTYIGKACADGELFAGRTTAELLDSIRGSNLDCAHRRVRHSRIVRLVFANPTAGLEVRARKA